MRISLAIDLKPHLCVALLLLCTIFLSHTACGDSLGIGHTRIRFPDEARNEREITMDIYYPAISDMENALPVAGRFPVIAFGHGFLMSAKAYRNFVKWVVPEGYIMVFPATESSIRPNLRALAKDLSACLNIMTVLGHDPMSIFNGHVDKMNCLMGHSMGGGAVFVAASEDSTIRSIATFAAAETAPSAILAARKVHVPALVVYGTEDCITPPGVNQLLMFDTLATTKKERIGIKGGSHCQMAAKSFLCSYGERKCKPHPLISRAEQHDIIHRFLIPWLDATLKGDADAVDTFRQLCRNDTTIITSVTTALPPQ